MSIEIREAVSQHIDKTKKVVAMMSARMGFDENMGKVNWKRVRRLSEVGYRFLPKEKGVTFTTEKIAGVKCIISTPENKSTDNIILYIHGGGFVSGSASSSKGYTSMLAKLGECDVYAVDYTLAPEKKYPTALAECVNVYNELAKRFPDSSITLTGESAGAYFCLAVTNKLLADNCKKPNCVIVHSPFVDFSGRLKRTIHEVDDIVVKKGCLKPLLDIYVGNGNVKSPLVSPIYGNFKEYPPLFITCDSNETLYEDSFILHEKAAENGVNVKMIEFKNTFHAFATLGTSSPEAKELMKENIEFIRANS